MGSDDATELHLDDTLKAGAGIVSAPAARILVEEGPERIRELAAWGARFDREEGRFHFTREGAHSRNRVLHALGDATGWEMVRALLDRAQRTARVSVRSFSCSVDLVVAGGAVAGCRFLSESGAVTTVIARATLLATGRGGHGVRGDHESPGGDGRRHGHGPARGRRPAGHGVRAVPPDRPAPLRERRVSSSPRPCAAEGAYLRNGAGERFTEELAPRDQVARAIARENRAGRGPVTLDLRHLDPDHIRSRFPRIRRHLCALRSGSHPGSPCPGDSPAATT
jgi:L-aspartate oxidase